MNQRKRVTVWSRCCWLLSLELWGMKVLGSARRGPCCMTTFSSSVYTSYTRAAAAKSSLLCLSVSHGTDIEVVRGMIGVTCYFMLPIQAVCAYTASRHIWDRLQLHALHDNLDSGIFSKPSVTVVCNNCWHHCRGLHTRCTNSRYGSRSTRFQFQQIGPIEAD